MDRNTITLSGQVYTLQPLTFGAWKRNKDKVRAIAEGQFTQVEDLMDAITDVVHASLLRAHPGVDRQVVEDGLDLPLAQAAYAQVLQLSVPTAPAGEMTGASQSGASTGTA